MAGKNRQGMLGIILSVCALLCCAAGVRAEELIFRSDFEQAEEQKPPAGWVMWGATQWKNPEYYTRDTLNPHSGQGCFRLYHPKNTGGYIVSAPEQALRPRRGMMYTVSFWARSDQPGPAGFAFMAYESINPFVDAPSPGRLNFKPDTEWRQYTFTVHEGWDFFAEQSRYLLLTFYPAGNAEQERTLWIDDVRVTEAKSPRAGRLSADVELQAAPLEHRLRPGESLNFTVDAARRVRRATRDAGGVSFHRVAGWTGQPYNKQGEYTLLPGLETAIREMRLPMTRFYGVGDEPFGLEGAIDRAAAMCRRVGVPEDHTVLEFETQGESSTLAPEVWARGVRYSRQKGYRFRYWEITNEPYIPNTVFSGPDDYIAHFKAVSAAVRREDPCGQIGIAILPGDLKWGSYVLKQCAGLYDFVVGHYYAVSEIYRRKFEAAVLTENYKTLAKLSRVNALIHAYNPGRDVYQYDTEWGMHSGGPKGERADNVDRNANIFGTLHRAVRLIYYTREDLLRGASSWQMFSGLSGPGFGILSQQAPEKRYLLYWLYYYFNRHVGEWVLPMDGTAPYYTPAAGDDPLTRPGEAPGPLTPALATLSADGKAVYLVIANGSWDRAVPCRVRLSHFQAAGTAGVLLSQSDPDGKPLLERKEDAISTLPVSMAGESLSCTIPPHSVAFITVQRKQ